MNTEQHETPVTELKRVVGVAGLAANVVNFSIGAGIFALPALIGIQLGGASLTGLVLCAIMFAAIILCYVEIGSRIKTTGGSYAYVEAAFGPFPAFMVNWLFFFGWSIFSDAAILNLVADSFGSLVPAFSGTGHKIILIFLLIVLMISVNVIGTRQGIFFVGVVTVVKLLPLFALMIFGWSHIGNAHWQLMPSLHGLESSALILFFAFAGFESSLSVSGEIKSPERTVPRGILLGGMLVLLIYLVVQIITQGVLGDQLEAVKDTPLASVAEKIFGPMGASMILIAAMVSGFSCVNGDVLCTSRLLYAGAEDNLYPKFLKKIHPRFATPHLAIITFAALIFLISCTGGFRELAVLASGALLLIYLAVVLAMIRLRFVRQEGTEKTFRIPGGLVVPMVAVASILWVLTNLSSRELISLALFVAGICLVYGIMRGTRKVIRTPRRDE